MAHRIHHPGGMFGWHFPLAPLHGAERRRDEVISEAWLYTSAAYLCFTLTILFLWSAGVIAEDALGGRLAVAVELTTVTAVLGAVGGVLYRLPLDAGSGLRLPGLAWAHFTLLNAAALIPLVILMDSPLLTSAAADRLTSSAFLAQVGGVLALIVNLFASIPAPRGR